MRTIIWFTYFWIYQLFTLPTYFRVKYYYKNNNQEKATKLIKKQTVTWATRLVKLAGGKVEVIGMENIPKDVPVVFVANHQSNFDIPVCMGYIGRQIGFVAKAESEKLPVIGNWMKYMNCVFIDRNDPRAALRSIKKGIEIVKSGNSLVIFPEGTRSLDGKMNEFKPGSFKLALKSKVPVIPITIDGTFNIMRKGSLKITPANVKFIIGKPIDTSEYKVTESYLLRERVFEAIQSKL